MGKAEGRFEAETVDEILQRLRAARHDTARKAL